MTGSACEIHFPSTTAAGVAGQTQPILFLFAGMFLLQDVLIRAQSVVVDCRDFMQSFQDGLWMAKAIFREKHKDRFQELHESLSYVFQVSILVFSNSCIVVVNCQQSAVYE